MWGVLPIWTMTYMRLNQFAKYGIVFCMYFSIYHGLEVFSVLEFLFVRVLQEESKICMWHFSLLKLDASYRVVGTPSRLFLIYSLIICFSFIWTQVRQYFDDVMGSFVLWALARSRPFRIAGHGEETMTICSVVPVSRNCHFQCNTHY